MPFTNSSNVQSPVDAAAVAERQLMFRQLRLRFRPELESAFRASQDARYHVQRVIFFAVCSASWLLGAFLNQGFFQVEPQSRSLVLLIELAWATPVLALASLMPLVTSERRWIYPCNVAGTLTLWGAVLSMHVLGQFGVLDYPIHMHSVSVMAVAFFGGFRFWPVLIGSTISMSLGVTAVWLGEQAMYPLDMYLYETFYLWVIAIFGLLAIELLNRAGFLYRRQIQALAQTDGLTGLLNRRAFEREYERVVRQAVRESCSLAVAMIDLDHFKRLNDEHGHALGDEALRRTGAALAAEHCGARPLDLRARYGGEEFVIVWYGPAEDSAEVLGRRIISAIRAIELSTPQGLSLQLTASIGIRIAVPKSSAEAADMLRRADQALYAVKNAGRDDFLVDAY